MKKMNHLIKLQEAVDDWLRPDNDDLRNAIEMTVNHGFFSIEDVKHRIRSLKKSITPDSLKSWFFANISDQDLPTDMDVLCLHAGNIPLVGTQDVLACALTGVKYSGKISRKDPYLLPSLLRKLDGHGILNNPEWSTKIEDFKGCRADCILFSGSAGSVKDVDRIISEFKLAKSDAEYLIRTAHYSVAVIDSTDSETMENLVEAVFRYGGRGCRSVAVVIAPFSLDSIKCELTDYIEAFWLKNPQHKKPPPSLFHRYAYNSAVRHPQAWLDDFLIEQTEMLPEQEFVMHWVVDEPRKVLEFTSVYGEGLQSVYFNRHELLPNSMAMNHELLVNAQNPPINWKPDGLDTINWLMDCFSKRRESI